MGQELKVLRLIRSFLPRAIAAATDQSVCRDLLDVMLDHEIMPLPWLQLERRGAAVVEKDLLATVL